jgi:DNA-binding SARP family transcriptional activator/tetratricopeptide (TPR) repeat protein
MEARMTRLEPSAPRVQPSCRIELFGNLRITCGGETLAIVNKPRLQALLAYLVLHSDAPQPRERLAFLMWPESTDAQARTNLRQLLHHLRHALPPECGSIVADHQTVHWPPPGGVAVDIFEFDAAVASAEKAAAAGDDAAEYERLTEAARLYHDDILPALYDEWLQPRREEYRRRAGAVFARLALLLEKRRDFGAAIQYAERLVAQDQLREAHHQLVIRLHELNHDRASALRAYHQCMRTLRRELGVEPSAATRELYERALKSDTAAAPPAELPRAARDSVAPMIGRDQEWRELTDYWRAASAGGVNLAIIAGEPGIGKSRLAQELYAWCKRAGYSVAAARCYGAQGRIAYAPVAEWLRSGALRDAWSQLPASQLAELARVLPEVLADHPSMPRPGSLREPWERHHFFDALNAAFIKARTPLLLVIDDLQWCDQDTFEWLHFFFRAGLSGVLIAGTVRADETDRDHPFARLWRELRQSDQALEIQLRPLDEASTAALGVQIANRGLSADEINHLYRATQGNPLFVVETVRAGLGEACGASTAPPRVRAVIVARLAQLTASAYELAGFAGAVGRAFSFDLLAKATDWDDDSLSRALDELWQRRLVERKDAGEYDFTHDLLRDVAYSELSPVRRRFLHRRIARALEELHSGALETVADQVAAQYESADMAEEAIRYYQISAEAARQRYADREAGAVLRRAIELCRSMPSTLARKQQELELLIALGRTLITTLGYSAPEVGEASAQAIALFRELKAARQGAPVLSCAWVFHVVRGEIAAARQFGEELLHLTAADQRAIASVSANFALGSVHFHLGEFELSQEFLEAALAESSQCSTGDPGLFTTPEIRIFSWAYITHVFWHLGRPHLALDRSEENVASANETDPFASAIALIYAAMLHVFRRDGRRALGYAAEAGALCRRYDIGYYASVAEVLSGWCRAMQGETAAGLAQLRRGFDELQTMGAQLRSPFYYALAGEACARAGKTGEAVANVSNGLAFQNRNGEIWAAPYLHIVHGDVLLQDGSVAQAVAAYERAVQSARQMKAPLLGLRAAVRMCEAHPHQASTRRLLEDLYAQFPPELDSPELRDARRLLHRNADRAAQGERRD